MTSQDESKTDGGPVDEPVEADMIQTIIGHPGVKMGGVGLVLIVVAMLWAIFVKATTPIGFSEVVATIGGIMVLTAIWRAADAVDDD